MDIREIKASPHAGILAPLSLVKETNKAKAKGGPTIAHQLRSRIERILDFAAAHGFRETNQPNPARPELLKVVLGNALPAKHHAAPPVSEAQELFARASIMKRWGLLQGGRISRAYCNPPPRNPRRAVG